VKMQKSVKIVSLGCSKNTVDSEKLLKQLQFAGYYTGNRRNNKKTDIVIVNTCGFINDAKEESINTILELVEARRRGSIGELYVMGCLSERYKDQLKKEIPEVDKYFGVNNPAEILKYLKYGYNKSLELDRQLTGPSHFAYLKVSEGCNRKCAFCAIPGIRGPYISTPIDDLVKEAGNLAGNGVKELILIAQDLSYFGTDLYRKPMLTRLCEMILDNTGIEWLRLHYLYPGNIPDDLLEMIKYNSRICKYIDLPIQHISDSILSAMKRNHTGDDTRKLLYHIRDYIPEVAIRTTLITGYPGETEKDFNSLLRFVTEFRFERLGVFTYSHEEDTYAYRTMSDNVPEKIKKERADEIMAVQQQISLQKNRDMAGKSIDVIIDSEENEYYIARSEYDSPEIDQEVLIKKESNILKSGEFYNVLITGSSEFDLEARFLS